jgi:hypothetical protein
VKWNERGCPSIEHFNKEKTPDHREKKTDIKFEDEKGYQYVEGI